MLFTLIGFPSTIFFYFLCKKTDAGVSRGDSGRHSLRLSRQLTENKKDKTIAGG